MIESDRQIILEFCMLQIAGKSNFQCKLRYPKAPKQAHLRMKNVSQTKNSSSK